MARSVRIDGYKNGKPDITWWRRSIQEGIDWRKKYAYEAHWGRWRDYYRGKWPANTLPVNVFFRMLRTAVPRIYFRNPSISVYATKPGLEQQLFAQLIERIDNKLIRTMDVKGQMKRMIHNAFMFGTGAGKLGFGAQYTPTPDERGDTEAPVIFNKKMTRRVEYHHLVCPNMPWFLSVHTGDLIVPKGLQGYEQTPWVAMQIKRNIHDLKADPRLQNTENLTSGSAGSAKPDDSKDDVLLYEVRDLRTGKCILMSAYGGASGNQNEPEPLMFEDDALQGNYRPNIYPLIFNPDDEVFWGIPDSQVLEPHQMELNEIRTIQMRHRRMSILKLLYKGGALDPAELEKMLNGDVVAAVRLNQSAEMSDVDVFETGHIPEGLVMADATVQGDIRDTMGFSRNQGGNYASDKSHNAPTAYEARIVEQAAEIRVDERRDACADVLVDIFEDANVLVFNEWDDSQVVQVMGPDSVPLWVEFKPNMLKGARYELNIDPDSTLPETKDLRQQKADKVYAVLKDNPLIDPQLLTSYYLREMHGVQYDHLMKVVSQMGQQMQNNAAAGVPGSTPENPINPGQLMAMMAGRGRPQGPPKLAAAG